MNDTVLRGGTVWQDERGMVNADVCDRGWPHH